MTCLDPLAGLVRSCLPDEAGPPADSDDLFRLYAVPPRAKGEQVSEEEVHDARYGFRPSVQGLIRERGHKLRPCTGLSRTTCLLFTFRDYHDTP
ncbi:hypothetical protein [Streptomyces sp. NPDC020571]|uniref:DUF7701 domain-containing protein n=1 Tax=Streptomyces sp. NPDC020571 TaxID=3365079 RepID=UPI0037AE5316